MSGTADPVDLPPGARRRVLALAADALGRLGEEAVPAALRPFVRFHPGRRAKLAGPAIAAALVADDNFRASVAEQVKAGVPDLAGAVAAGGWPEAADPDDLAALAYLLRPAGWADRLRVVGERDRRQEARAAEADQAAQVDRLRAELATTQRKARDAGQRLRQQLAEAGAEVDRLRASTREYAGELRRAREDADRAAAALAEERRRADRAAAERDGELRRLRKELADLREQADRAREAVRDRRAAADTRLWLQVDTLIRTAEGLREELGLRPSARRPADAVPAARPEPAASAGVDHPDALGQLLALPHAHLVVDGYNVTKTGYPDLPLVDQRARLLGRLAGLAARTGAEVTVVFDGAERPPVAAAAPRGVRVLFSPSGQTADELIRRLVRAEPMGRPVLVVSSDAEVAAGIRRGGARAVPAGVLLEQLRG